MNRLAIFPHQLVSSYEPTMVICQGRSACLGASISFPLTEENILALREAADKCEAYLADYTKRKEIEARVQAEMEGAR